MRCLVTGASGFIGSHVAEALRGRGDDVATVVRKTSDTRLLEELGVQLVVGDLADATVVQSALDGVQNVVHCAAKVGDWGPIDEYRQTNVEALRALLDACVNRQLGRFVLVSSLGVYHATDHHGTDETAPLPEKHIDGYTQTKVEAERLAMQYHRERGLPLVVLRPGFVYGPRDRTVMPKILKNLRWRMVNYFGSRHKVLNNVYVGNVVEAVLLALEKPAAVGQAFNITDPALVSKKVFFETIASMAGLPRPMFTYPMWVGKLMCWITESIARLTGAKPLLSSARLKFLGLNLDYSIEKARRELGYQPSTTFDAGIRRTMDWLREQGKIR
jgi:nucleoside-diphosphate-sugar epimerase